MSSRKFPFSRIHGPNHDLCIRSITVAVISSKSAAIAIKSSEAIGDITFRACSYGQKFSRFPRKHFDRLNNVVLFIWRNVFPLTG